MIRRLALAVLLAAAAARADDVTKAYDALLGRIVRIDGVDYALLKKERKTLDAYVAALKDASPGTTNPEKIAFWINAYNAATLQQVLDTWKGGDDYSVKDVSGFWTKRTWKVAGKDVTLDGMEKGILLKEFSEPRVHFAVNCASRSCPPLAGRLWRAETLDVELSRATRAYLANEEENEFDPARQRAEVSRIFLWYRADFEKGRKSLQAFFADYAPREKLARALRRGRWYLKFRDYDWSLNRTGAPKKERDSGGGLVWLLLYLIPTLGLLLYGFHAFKMLSWRRKKGDDYRDELRAARAASPLGTAAFPRVLVQLPVFNEGAVVERAIDAVCALDYPRDRLEIQVVDDSTDASRELIDGAVARHAAAGVPVRVVRRAHRAGFKAGALAAGLHASDAAYVAIFDADFVPAPDFVRRALPLFDAPGRVACVQGRWEHLNRDQNWLTRAQAVGVDAHFHIQQLARAATGHFLNFNGTAGMWRVAAIEDAGGWEGDTLTEDLDLSYRAQLNGWRIVFDPDLAVPAELPPTLGAYKSQQRRWACGSIQCARKYLGRVWRAPLPFGVKTEATVHLCGYVVCLAMVALVLALPFGIGHLPVLSRYPQLWPLWISIWAAAAGPLTVSWAGQRVRGVVRRREILGAFLLGLGSCMNNTIAVVRGLVRPIRTFVRTPKQGSSGAPARSPAPRVEPAMMLFSLASVAYLLTASPWTIATYALFCSAGFCCLTTYWWVAERRGGES